MPIYEYRCEACGHQEDHLQKVSEKPLTKCPACGKTTYKKQLSAAGFQLKGSGWYVTDYARAGSGNGAKKEGGKEPAASESTSDTKSEAKPETKPASTSEKPAS